MFQPFESGAGAPQNPHGHFSRSSQSEPRHEKVRLMAHGSPAAVRVVIKDLHRVGYAEPNEWSRQMPGNRPGEVMSILTKTVQV